MAGGNAAFCKGKMPWDKAFVLDEAIATDTQEIFANCANFSCRYAPVSRCGGVTYARVSEYYDIPRPGKEHQDKKPARE